MNDDIIRMAREAGSIDSEEVIGTVWAAFAAAEREAIIDIVAMHGGSVEIEAAIRARGTNE